MEISRDYSMIGAGVLAVVVGAFVLANVLSPSPCTENWVCGEWSACTNEKQFRSCIDANQCSTNEFNPAVERACQNIPPVPVCGDATCNGNETCQTCASDCGTCSASCMENWSCGEWSACTGNTQTRTCTDINRCGTRVNLPNTQQSCTPPEPEPEPLCGNGACNIGDFEDCNSCPQDCGVCPPVTVSNDIPVRVTLGSMETVFDYDTQHCAYLDLPDIHVKAFRDFRGEVVLVSGNAPDLYWMYGQNFNQLTRSCNPVLRSANMPAITDFAHMQWITSTYTEDGRIIHGMVHSEYHDPIAPNCAPGDTQPSNPCWYNYVSYVRSTNGGRNFSQADGANKVVAILPYQWSPIMPRGPNAVPPPHGYFAPTTIVKKGDYYYMLVLAYQSRTNAGDKGNCLMRTNNLNDSHSWKFWDGEGFNIQPINPYPTQPTNPDNFRCAYVGRDNIYGLSGSLTYNTYLEKYMLIGGDVFPHAGNPLTCGFWFALSDDLITWGKPQFIRESQFGHNPCKNNPNYVGTGINAEDYPSLIDHDSPDRSFTTADNTAYLYFTQNRDNHNPGGWGLRRNLVRIPITFTKT